MCAKWMSPSPSVSEIEIKNAVLGEVETERRSTKRIHFRAQSMYTWSVRCVEIGWTRVTDGRVVVEVDWDGREGERERESKQRRRGSKRRKRLSNKKRNEIFRCFLFSILSPMPYLPFPLALNVPSLSLCWAGSHMASNKMIEQGQVEDVKWIKYTSVTVWTRGRVCTKQSDLVTKQTFWLTVLGSISHNERREGRVVQPTLQQKNNICMRKSIGRQNI